VIAVCRHAYGLPFAVLLLLLIFPISIISAEFHVAGVCKYTSYKSTGPDIAAFPFEVAVSNCQWAMRITEMGTNGTFGYTDVTYDGKYTYYLDYQRAWEEHARQGGGKDHKENVAVGSVGKQQVPHFPFAHQAGAIWLTYASRCYFGQFTSGDKIQPSAAFGADRGNSAQVSSFLLQKADWHIVQDADGLGLPERVVYMDDGISGVLPDGRILRWPAPYDQGFTNTTYEAFDYTNLANLRIPLRSRMQTFVVDLGPRSPTKGLRLRFRYDILATNVNAGLPLDTLFQPRIPGVTFVQDERFSRPGVSMSVSYTVRDGLWRDDNRVRSSPEYASTVRQTPEVTLESRRFRRLIVISAFVACSALAAWWGYKTKTRKSGSRV